jgi:uncharacterized protein (TIRG00374 family)
MDREKQKSLVKWVSLALGIILAAVFLTLAIRGVSWPEMLGIVRQANPLLLALSILYGSLSIFLRGLRWGVLISAQKKVPAWIMFFATAVGYLGNTFLPARAGEVLRSVLLGRKAGIPKSFTFATAITERIFDAVTLVLIAVVVIPGIGTMPEWLPQAMRVMGVLGGIVIVGLLILPRVSEWVLRMFAKLPLPSALRQQAEQLLREFFEGAAAFINPGRAFGIIAFSALVWFMDASAAVTVSHALGWNMTYPQALLTLAAMGLSSAIPSTPGYIGIYQFVATTLLPVFGVTRTAALSYILVLQATIVAAVVLWGLPGLWLLGAGKVNQKEPDSPLV